MRLVLDPINPQEGSTPMSNILNPRSLVWLLVLGALVYFGSQYVSRVASKV